MDNFEFNPVIYSFEFTPVTTHFERSVPAVSVFPNGLFSAMQDVGILNPELNQPIGRNPETQKRENMNIFDMIGFTPEDSAMKDQALGYAGLDEDSLLKQEEIPNIPAYKITESETKVFVSPQEKQAITHSNREALDAVEGVNTGDQDLSGLATKQELTDTETSLVEQINTKQNNLGFTPENTSKKGVSGGYAGLDNSGRVPNSQLPSFVDEVQEFDTMSLFPRPGRDSIIYIDLSTNKTYRRGGTDYAEISPSLALGETPQTAFAGDKGKQAYDHISKKDNPHEVTKEQVGLGQVNNTSDADKPISNATQQALNNKQDSIEYTPEDAGNKEVGSLSNSDVKYPASSTVKTGLKQVADNAFLDAIIFG